MKLLCSVQGFISEGMSFLSLDRGQKQSGMPVLDTTAYAGLGPGGRKLAAKKLCMTW